MNSMIMFNKCTLVLFLRFIITFKRKYKYYLFYSRRIRVLKYYINSEISIDKHNYFKQ